MDSNREKELVALLNKYDIAGVPFHKAKDELLAKGYTEAEIIYGLYSAPFDGKVNAPRPANPLQKFYEQNPDKAERLAKNLLLAQAEMGWDKAVSFAAVTQVPLDPHAKSYYELRAADQLGIPYFTLMLLGIVLFMVAIKLDLSNQTTNTIFLVYNISVNAWFGYKLFQEHRRVSKLRKELRSNKN